MKLKSLPKMQAKIIAICIAIAMLCICIVFIWNINGESFELTNRELKVDQTNSMACDSRYGIVKNGIDSIPVYSLVVIKILNENEKKDLVVGDVVEFTAGNQSITHRIVKIDYDTGTCCTQGDNSPGADPPRKITDIQGKVVGVNQPLGLIVTFVQNNLLLVIVMLILVLILLDMLEYIYKGLRDEKSEEPGKV